MSHDIILVGSRNPVKVDSVIAASKLYPNLEGYDVRSMEVDSGVSEQPLSLEEIIHGATNRAKNAFDDYKNGICIYSFGLESGLMKVPETKTGYMDVCACSIYDGEEFSLGLSPAFEFPINVTKMMIEEKITAEEALNKCGITRKTNIGKLEGAIGILTQYKITRKDQTRLAIHMAIIQIQKKELYSTS